MSEPAATKTIPTRPNDQIDHDYIHVVEADEHRHQLTRELLDACSKNYSKPVLFRQLVPFDKPVDTREFLEIETGESLLWREKKDDSAVRFRDESGKTDYNYVTGREGTAAEYLDEIFQNNKDVYAHLGTVSSGFTELHKHKWGTLIFRHIHDEVFRHDWCRVPEWELSGHCFIGNNTEMYAEPGKGAPGSDWHMFPTVNLFVMIAGVKQWMTRPPLPGDQFKNQEELVFPSGGREGPVEEREYDTVYLESGDVLFNMPYEWHKVLNARGPSVGAAFRVIDRPYIDQLMAYPAVKANLKLRKMNDEYSHLATSMKYASYDPVRMAMGLNTIEMMACTAARFNLIAN